MDLNALSQEARRAIDSAATAKDLEELKIKYLGRKGALTKILRSLANKSLAERQRLGQQANLLKKELDKSFQEKLNSLKLPTKNSNIDITLPGKKIRRGHQHLLTQATDNISYIFRGLGFAVIDGPELETEYYNFDALNVPHNHPARDLWDTFWIKPREQGRLLRTHTSPVQIRFMESHQPPFRVIVPGRVFRHEATDFSHEFNFHQLEGLMVGKNVSMANLKYIVINFLRHFFQKDIQTRFRPSYFPFTEPSVEIDIKIPGRSDWLEVMGAGLVHPRVFAAAKYNPADWQGFAFGFGIERLVMIKHKIPDIRLFHSGDLRFIKQF